MVSSGLYKAMDGITEKLKHKQSQFDYNLQMDDINHYVGNIKQATETLANSKFENLVKE